MSWCAVVPVKALASAKSRLHADATSDQLAFAFAQDTITALLGASRIMRVVVTTSDSAVASWAQAAGAEIHDDSQDPGINAAVRAAADGHARAGENVAVVLSDLPCLTADAIDVVLAEADRHPLAFLADAEGTGTTMWFSRAGTGVRTRFGPQSRDAHADSGAVDLVLVGAQGAWPAARRDVDTAEDLAAAIVLGVGPHTRTLVN